MPQVQLDDEVFTIAQRRAADGGYSSVEAYIAEVLIHDAEEEVDNLDHLFTPERLAHIGKAAADIKAGNYFTNEQAKEALAKLREEDRTFPSPRPGRKSRDDASTGSATAA